MNNEGAVAFIGGVGASLSSDTNGDAVYEYFGPFYIGPDVERFGGRDAVGVS
jgi:hypothetical protein